MSQPAPFTFTTAIHVPLSAIVRTLNAVYPQDGDTAEDYAGMLATTQVELGHSVIALDAEGRVAGIAMLGVRGRRGWCGDAAVAPQYQNRKLGQDLMRRFSDAGHGLELRTLQLEVRDDNAPARRVYEKEGYQYTRRMPSYVAALDQLGWRTAAPVNGLAIRPVQDETEMRAALLRWYNPQWAPVPCWERELPTLLSVSRPGAWVAEREGREIAFLWASLSGSDKSLQIGHLALTAAAGPEEVRALCTTAASEMAAEKLRIGLEPYDSRVAAIFREFGFGVHRDLWEMVKTL